MALLTPSTCSSSGSEEERIAVETASRYGSKPNVYSAAMAEDVSVEVKMDGEGPRMGADAKLSILVKNLSSSPRRTTLHSQVAVMYYTGVLKGTIKKEQLPVELLANEGWFSPLIFEHFKYFFFSFSDQIFFSFVSCYLQLYKNLLA